MTLTRKAIIISYAVSLPCCLFALVFFAGLPFLAMGEGLLAFILFPLFGKSFAVMFLAFILALAFAGKTIVRDLEKGRGLLTTAFLYSLRVNSSVWGALLLAIIVRYIDPGAFALLILPIAAYFISVIMATPTVGLLVCYLVKGHFEKSQNQIQHQAKEAT